MYNKSMFWVLLFFAELLFLFFLSRQLTKSLSYLLFHWTKNPKITIYSMSLIFFPGTVLHELAHALTAGILGVRIGAIEFVPVMQGDHVKLGSVQIAHTDFLRRFLIGAAPFFSGTALLLAVLYFASHNNLFSNIWITILLSYIVFEIGNTMFSSKKDMEGALELLLSLIVICIIFYFLGVRIPSIDPNIFFERPVIINTFQKGTFYLLIPILIDITIVLLLRIIKSKK